MTSIDNFVSTLDEIRERPRGSGLRFFAYLVGLCVAGGLFISYLNSPPVSFEGPKEIEIPSGSSVQDITEIFAEADIVRSAPFLQFCIQIFFDDAPVLAGVYIFDEPDSALEVARIITSGEAHTPRIRLTVPEGLSVDEIDLLLTDMLTSVEPGDFVRIAKAYEGYLFPDTYFLTTEFDASSTAEFMKQNFNTKITPLLPEIENSERTLDEIIIMASILEKEANDPESKGLVAGILWKRLDMGMRLQVDAPFAYVLNKHNSELTPQDLETDTPYNTYLYAGLTPTPIGNPGLVAIEAALRPTVSPYLYYITGDDGVFRYAKTFEEHKQNIARYLRE